MPPTLRPLSTSQLLDQTFALYRKNFVLFAGILAVPQVVVLVLQLAVMGVPAAARGIGAGGALVAGISGVVFGLSMIVVSIVGYSLAHAATVNAVSAVYLERTTSIGEAYGRVRDRVGKIINVVISVWIRVFLGFLLLIVPGIIWALRYSLAVPAITLENLTAKEAMERSKKLTQGRYGEIFLIYFLFALLSYIVILAITVPIMGGMAVAKFPTNGIAFQLANHLCAFVATVIVTPFATIALALVYYDQRVRKEAFDLQLMMQTIDGSAASATAGGAGTLA